MQAALDLIGKLNDFVWGDWTLFLLLGAGILFTIWSKFSQIMVLGHGVAVTRGKYDNPGDRGAINHFQALSAALSATIGLGNIGGVAIAIAVGGPGALFWMWVVGFLGMALKTVEITLAMLYRSFDKEGEPHGGAMWVIDKTLGVKGGGAKVFAKLIGGTFCVTLIIFAITGGNMFQAWNVADLSQTYFGIPKIATGIVLAIIVGLVIIGGIKRIGRVAAKIVPIMCVLYLLSALAVLAMNVAQIPAMLVLIVKSAFSGTEAAGAFMGGSAGIAFLWGMKRALFSNEAGLGSAPIAHAAARTNEPAREGIVGGLGPFIDTILICSMTALVIISTGTWNRGADGDLLGGVELISQAGATTLMAPNDVGSLPKLRAGDTWGFGQRIFLLVSVPNEEGVRAKQKLYGTITGDLGYAERIAWDAAPAGAQWIQDDAGAPMKGVYRDVVGATMTAYAFDRAFSGLGKWMVTIASWLFAVSTMISWSYYGEQGVIYMFGKNGVLPYKIIYLILAMVGSVIVQTTAELDAISTLGAGMMLWANMAIVLTCGFLAIRSLDDYFKRLKAGEIKPHEAGSITDLVDGK